MFFDPYDDNPPVQPVLSLKKNYRPRPILA